MSKPIILAVDDDPTVLRAVERDLRSHYGKDYRILPINQGGPALEYLRQVKDKNETVALFLVDQRMPQMTGVEFLAQARRIFPNARKVLLTAYADTEAAIASINAVGLDYYLMKPWDPPEEHLYPVLDDLLEDWWAIAEMPYEGIRLAGTLWSPASHQIKEFLTRHQIPYRWLDAEKDPDVHQMVELAGNGEFKYPVVYFPDGSVLVKPTLRELAEKTGMQTRAEKPYYELIIIGAGPAGLAAAVYASSEGLRCLVVERHAPGGQAGSSPKIENYLGFPGGISGMDLARRAVTQVRRFGAEILSAQEVMRVSIKDDYRVITLSDGTEISCHALLLASGASYNMLGIPGVEALTGAGIYYGAAYTEALYYKDKHVYVLGGANSAAQGAMYLSRFASKVSVIYRGPQLKAAVYLVEAMQADEKIEILLNTEVIEVLGTDALEEIIVKDALTGEQRSLKGEALFVFIGVQPQSGLVADIALHDEKGYLITGQDLVANGKRPKGWRLERDPFPMETSVPGIFAAGDVRYGTNHRVASATGEGGVAVAMIRQYLKTL